ncbi:hypothetical protein B0H21DRAFT_839330 [Amylocystis lapponica]|nr:hypothetical protein B0H21DRAFT_839330 [Amylocystis lapponica]
MAEFTDEQLQLADYKQMAEDDSKDIDLVLLWQSVDASNDEICLGSNAVVCLAIWLLSIIANSAGCEHVFSEFRNTHTKHRSHLSPEKVHKTAMFKMDIRKEHVCTGLAGGVRKYKFGQDSKSVPVPVAEGMRAPDQVDAAADAGASDSNNPAQAAGPGLDFYWHGGVRNFEQELANFNIEHVSQNPRPSMADTSATASNT